MDTQILRRVISENLRIQNDGKNKIDYIDTSNALESVMAKQNHVIFARRGCGKTLLLETLSSKLSGNEIAVYLDCEEYKSHSFPNVIIEILDGVLSRIKKETLPSRIHLHKRKKAKNVIDNLMNALAALRERPDEQEGQVTETSLRKESNDVKIGTGKLADAFDASIAASDVSKEGIEKTYKIYDKKIEKLYLALPEFKRQLREYFHVCPDLKCVFIQIDDFYHLQREKQPYVVNYVHSLCKGMPMYFKIATLRHASTLYIENNGQPIGIQERHDFQPIQIDFTFEDFKRTEVQIKEIFYRYGKLAGGGKDDVDSLFRGDAFRRLILAGGGVPRDCLSLFLEALTVAETHDGKITKDDIRNLSLSNSERIIRELKEESQKDEFNSLIKGIFIIREFCLDERKNIFVISDKLLHDDDNVQRLIYRLLDYKIIHTVETALTHKSQQGTYKAFMINIGFYANHRKLAGKMNEIDLSSTDAREKLRSAPILTEEKLAHLWSTVPSDPEVEILKN